MNVQSTTLSEASRSLTADQLIRTAIQLLEQGDPVAALRKMDMAFAQGVELPGMHYIHSVILCNVGRHEEGLVAAQAELRINPGHTQAQEQVNYLSKALAKTTVPAIPTHQRPWSSSMSHETLYSIQQGSHNYTYRGVPMIKNPFDQALYPMLLWDLKPRTIIEIGSKEGGSALWMGDMLDTFGIDGHIYSVDIVRVNQVSHPRVTFIEGNGRALSETFTDEFLESLPHPWLVIEDADHNYPTTKHVLEFFHNYLHPGEYIVVEDGIISDLTKDPTCSSGPHLALKEFLKTHPTEYEIDGGYCDFYGYNLTWNTNGYLKKVAIVPGRATHKVAGQQFPQTASLPLPSSAETIDRYRLRDYNLLAFPDWEQPEDQLFESLSLLLQSVLLHPQRTRITLLLDATGVDPEAADWAISSVVMHLMEQTDVEPEGAPEIVLLSEMESDPTQGEAPLQRWRILLPFVAARVVLQRESSMVEVGAEAGTVTSCPVETLLEANLQTFRFAQEAEIKAQAGKGLVDADTLPYLLAALQYFYPHEVEWTFDLPSVPPWLLKPLMEYWLATPPIFHRVGESADYLHFVQKLTAYLHQEILQNQRSPFWQEIAEFFILRLHLIPLYFNQEDLRQLYRQRAEILEAVLTHQGTTIDHEFGGRGDRPKIRLGVLAAHFYPETETFATLPVFQHLDRQKFEVILYSIEPFNHRLAQHCTRHADSVVELPRTTDGRVARIREDDLDILFIASNVTAVTNWVTLVAPHRMARLQVVGMNSPVSTEMTHIDYYLSSRLTNPSFDVQMHYRETVVQLDGPAQCFDFATEAQPAPTQKLSREVLGIAPDAVVFVSGANFHKITPELEATWAKVIAGVPNAVLLLYPFNISWSSEYPEAAFRDRLAASFAREGVSADRFLLLPNAPNRGDVLERLKLADVYLDSHPFSGMTSLVDPLQLGLSPIVMELDLPVSLARGAAFLRDLGIPELIVESEAAYVQLAIALGTQPKRRQELRDRILQGMAKAPGFLDSRRYGKEMSRVFESLFEAYQTEANQQQASATAPAAQPKTVGSQPLLQVNQPIARHSMRGALLQINRLGFEPATVIDVGAALGTFDLYELFPQSRHILIEPIAENEPYLAKICKKLGNAEYYIAAAASEPGTLTLSVNPGLVNSSLVTAEDTTAPTAEMRTVKVVSLDQLCRDRHLQPPFLVKVDVDGKEMEVLKGAVQVLEATEYLIIESTCFGQINEVVDFMREHGFAIYDIVDPVYRPGDHALWQVDLAFVKQSGQFRQSHGYVESSSDGINQQQVWEHHHRYRAQLIDYIERNYGESDASASETSADLGFTPKPITWIAFPDWQQPEETLFDDLTQVVRRVLKAGDRQQHMLLLDASSIDSDDANLMLADAVMYLLQDEGLEVDEDGPEIVLLPEINLTQWQQLAPSLAARVKLAHEGSVARLNLAVDLPVVELEPR
jgi:FkbM family methyltransferase